MVADAEAHKEETMKVTPLDVGSRRFPRRFRGYDPGEVNIFLEMVSQEMEDLVQENRFLSEDLRRKNAELMEHKETERHLKEAMVAAQRLAEDMKAKMLKEAQAVVAQAELEAESIIAHAQARVLELQAEIRGLRDDRIRAREELRALINTYTALLEADEHAGRSEDDNMAGILCVMPARKGAAVRE
jgi:cell division initiation protein